jgi:NAD(P)-dependent dehydrogenase (short-subunit alcohol dehydrogenase family)
MTKPGIAIVTGACGGIGRACARALGRTYDLVLTDIAGVSLAAFSETLKEEGYSIGASVAGDLAEPRTAPEVVDAARRLGGVRAVAHTAGLSPALAQWDRILQANAIGAERLLLALEDGLEPQLAVVLIASMAGYMAPADPALDAALAHPLAGDLLDVVGPLLDAYCVDGDAYGRGSPAYSASKRAMIRTCERRAAAWGRKGARLLSISPGTIWTPMGRREAETNPGAAAVVAATPLGRWGSPLDIAAGVAFLTSDAASFITGCDLRIDGGVTPALRPQDA